MKLNLRGQELSVNRSVLTQVKGSTLNEIFTDLDKVPNQQEGEFFQIDRDPLIFELLVEYLKSERRYIPKDLSGQLRRKLEAEIKYWKCDKGLQAYDQLTYPQQEWQVMQLLKKVPSINKNG